jgi:hypothetical protein
MTESENNKLHGKMEKPDRDAEAQLHDLYTKIIGIVSDYNLDPFVVLCHFVYTFDNVVSAQRRKL